MKRIRLGSTLATVSAAIALMAFAERAPQDAEPADDEPQAGRITGVGGLFFEAEKPAELQAWYAEHLGIGSDAGGFINFMWRELDDPGRVGRTIWSAFPKDTEYFDPGGKPFMFNYRVDDLEALLERLQAEGVETVGEIEEYEYGKFGWILDPEGTKVELWEPPEEKAPVPAADEDDDAAGDVDDGESAAVRAALASYYDAMSEREWDAYAAHFHDGAVLATRWVPPGGDAHEMMMSSVPDFIARAAEGPGSQPIFEERMTGAEIRIQHDLAQAWATYEAKFGTEENLMEWTGTDAFTLIRFRGEWKIVSLAFAAER